MTQSSAIQSLITGRVETKPSQAPAGHDFAQELITTLAQRAEPQQTAPPQQLANHANELVNHVFYGTLLREFRETQNDPLLGNSSANRVFLKQLDMAVIRESSKGRPNPIARALIEQLEGPRTTAHSARQDRLGEKFSSQPDHTTTEGALPE